MIIKMLKNMFNHKSTEETVVAVQQKSNLAFRQRTQAPGQSLLDSFFSVNYEQLGYDEGYEFHNSDIIKIKHKKIKADYLLQITRSLDLLKVKAHKLELQLTESEELSELIADKIKAALKFNKEKQDHLLYQRELTAMDEGIIMNAIHGYTLGFKQGALDYVEEMMISHSDYLFTSTKQNKNA